MYPDALLDLRPNALRHGQRGRSTVLAAIPVNTGSKNLGAPYGQVNMELAVTVPQLRILPSARANAVPDPSSGVPTRPPGAFTVRLSSIPRYGSPRPVVFTHLHLISARGSSTCGAR